MSHNPFNTEINMIDRIRKAMQNRKTLHGTPVTMSQAEKLSAVKVEQHLADAIILLQTFS